VNRKIKIIVTDEDGTVLDSTELEVNNSTSAIAIRQLAVGHTTRIDEEDEPLVIGGVQ
jgi:hydroxymethylpyrimidine pyrophosphatase-like HAD family hydrolase